MVKWKELCKPREQGGVGLRSLEHFHEALMGRQILKGIKDPNARWDRLTKAKYGHGGFVWRVKQVKGCSQVWTAVSKGVGVLCNGLRWEIGNGVHIDIMREPWIDNIPLERMPTLIANEQALVGLPVAYFIEEGRSWNKELLALHFGEELVEKILKIRIRGQGFNDECLWNGIPLTEVTTKKLFHAVQVGSDCRNESAWPFRWVWKIDVAFRVRCWLWRLVKEAIATKDFLWRRSLVTSMRCPRCQDFGEDVFHLIVDCHKSMNVWMELGVLVGAQLQVDSMAKWWELVKNNSANRLRQSQLCYAAWMLWKDRNAYVFGGDVISAKNIASRAVAMAEERAMVFLGPQQLNLQDVEAVQDTWVAWSKPPNGWFKVNFDGYFHPSSKVAIAGFTVRDWEGRLLVSTAQRDKASSAFEIEAKAALAAVKWCAHNIACSSVILEGDSKELIDYMHQHTIMDATGVVHEIFCHLLACKESKVVHVLREGNQCAHWMVNEAARVQQNLQYSSSPPLELAYLLRKDATGFSYVRR